MSQDVNHISLITKIRAMEGRLLTEIDYNNMKNMSSILEVYAYLQDKYEYKDIFDKHDDIVELHRNQLEHLLIHVLYSNIIKIYKFAIGEERKLLDIVITRFEIDMLKKCISNINKNNTDGKVITYASFFKKHSDVNFDKLYKAKDINQFIRYLKGSRYYKILKHMEYEKYDKLAEYEKILDKEYFLNIWNNKSKLSTRIEEIVTEIIGTEIDLYNLKNIYRCKKFYNMKSDLIKGYIVNIGYKIKKSQLEKLIETDSISEFIQEFNKTYYSKLEISFDIKNIETSFENAINKLHINILKKEPNSLARVYVYFDKKNYEIHNITRIIENIRYKKLVLQ